MTKKPKDNTVGPWAKGKLEALGQYLSFFTTVLKKQGSLAAGHDFRRCLCRAWSVPREGERKSR
jgi:hypothetical protein